VLDLEHNALVRLITAIDRLGDNAVKAGSLELAEPSGRDFAVPGGRGQVDRRRRLRHRLLEHGAAALEWKLSAVLIAECEQVEGYERRGGLAGQQPDPARGGMDPLQQGLEVQPPAIGAGYDDLAVDNGPGRQAFQYRGDQLGKVPGHRTLVAAADLDLIAVAEDDRPEAIPFRLIAQLALRDLLHGLGEHRGNGRHHGQVHRPIIHEGGGWCPRAGASRQYSCGC
jgi:hypothetical protein